MKNFTPTSGAFISDLGHPLKFAQIYSKIIMNFYDFMFFTNYGNYSLNLFGFYPIPDIEKYAVSGQTEISRVINQMEN